IVERVKSDIGPYFQRRLRDALGDHPIVGEIAGAGLVAGVQLARNRDRRERFGANVDIGTICRD
ncbi:aspartate aminotransferase family protein, partial [Burkholderia contaminans]